MAERRMFAKTIVLSDAFLDMPMSARCLYFTLGMLADDDGFVNSPRSIMRQCGASDDDMKLLIAKRFVLLFESGVIVIKHWRINNYLQKDRYTQTKYLDEKQTLTVDQNGSYHKADMYTQVVYTQNRLGKDSKDKYKEGKFTKPTLEEITTYCTEKGYTFDPFIFYNYYESNGWMVGKNHMKNWKSALSNWQKRQGEFRPQKSDVLPEYMTGNITPTEERSADEVKEMLNKL